MPAVLRHPTKKGENRRMAAACATMNVSDGGNKWIRKITIVPWLSCWFTSWLVIIRSRAGRSAVVQNLAVELLVPGRDLHPGKTSGRLPRRVADLRQFAFRQRQNMFHTRRQPRGVAVHKEAAHPILNHFGMRTHRGD